MKETIEIEIEGRHCHPNCYFLDRIAEYPIFAKSPPYGPFCRLFSCRLYKRKGKMIGRCANCYSISLRKEYEDLQNQLESLSRETVYQGNSVQHWWAKANACSGIVSAVCKAFRRLGYTGEMGNLDTLPARLNAFVDTLGIEKR